MKKVLKMSGELTPAQIYLLTMSPKSQRVSDNIGVVINVKAWALFEDVDKKNPEVTRDILAFIDDEGSVYATVSETFKSEFFDMLEVMGGSVPAIEVVGGTSKNGRSYVTCTLANI